MNQLMMPPSGASLFKGIIDRNETLVVLITVVIEPGDRITVRSLHGRILDVDISEEEIEPFQIGQLSVSEAEHETVWSVSMTNLDRTEAPRRKDKKKDNGYELYTFHSYHAISERLRKTTSSDLQCQVFCGGKGCKYCGGFVWPDQQAAIKGLFSHW